MTDPTYQPQVNGTPFDPRDVTERERLMREAVGEGVSLRIDQPRNVPCVFIIPAAGADLSDEALDAEIARLEASMARYEEADPDEIESDEYAILLTRLTKLTEEREGRPPARDPLGDVT